MKNDILTKTIKLLKSELKQLKELVTELNTDFDSLISRIEHIEDINAENYNEEVHDSGKIDDCFTEDQIKRIRTRDI